MITIFCLTSLANGEFAYGKKVHGKVYKYKINIPGTMQEAGDTIDNGENEQLYIDTANDVVLIISGRVSTFRSVNDYIDCANNQLEQKLQTAFGDSSLKLISCSRSKYYPGKSAVVHFSIAGDSNAPNTYVVYFIHDKKEDLQISFAYQKESEEQSIAYVDGIMQTFRLK